MSNANLLIIVGQEGAGKSTTIRALVRATPNSAQIDAEDVGAVNPWRMDDAFLRMLWKNVADLTKNFWSAGFRNVIAGSFMSNVEQYKDFRDVLNRDADVYVVQLCATKATREVRRIEREKETSEEWRDMVDRTDPEDRSFASSTEDYRFLRIDNDRITVDETVERIRLWAPELYAPTSL